MTVKSDSLLIPLDEAHARLTAERIFPAPKSRRWLLARCEEGRFGGCKIGREHYFSRANFEAWMGDLRARFTEEAV